MNCFDGPTRWMVRAGNYRASKHGPLSSAKLLANVDAGRDVVDPDANVDVAPWW